MTAALKQNIDRKTMNNYCTYTFQISHVIIRFEIETVVKNKHNAFVINITML
jgi:hypothetical protein